MSAENQHPCSCELCQPNWYMGRGDEAFTPQPEQQEAELEQTHARKVFTGREVDEIIVAAG